MAYLARIEPQFAEQLAFLTNGDHETPPAEPEFSELEWSVIRLARIDGLSTLREPGPLRRFYRWLTNTGSPKLANPQLEVLRRIAVLSWHFGFTVPGDDVADFLAEGFSPEQYELLVTSINAAISANSKRIH